MASKCLLTPPAGVVEEHLPGGMGLASAYVDDISAVNYTIILFKLTSDGKSTSNDGNIIHV